MVRACPVTGQAAHCGHTTVSNFSSAITHATLPANGARDESATPLSGTGFTHRSPLMQVSKRAAPRDSGAAAVHVWATAGPPCLPAEAAATVEAIVRAVHHGDDVRIRILLAALVDVADTEVLLHLRERLRERPQ